jgi:hypothetical protein
MGRAFGVVHRTRNLKDSHRQECLCHGVSQTFLSVFRHLSDNRAVPGQVSGEVRIALVGRAQRARRSGTCPTGCLRPVWKDRNSRDKLKHVPLAGNGGQSGYRLQLPTTQLEPVPVLHRRRR